jgi:hypothetical protein
LGRKPSELLLGGIFCEVFFWNLGMLFLVFFLGTTSHIMTPCADFPFLDFFRIPFAPISNQGQTGGARRVC